MPLIVAGRKIYPESQIVTAGEMTTKEYEAYIDFVKRIRSSEDAAHKYIQTHGGHSIFDLFRITMRCAEPMLQYPSSGQDGSKYACDLRSLPKPCVIYSFGSAENYIFEEAVRQFGCSIYTFDCFAAGQNAPSYITYYPWCVDGHNHDNFYTIPTIMDKLGHKRVDYLKIDVEGAEYAALPAMISLPPERLPRQIAVEIHPSIHPSDQLQGVKRLWQTIDLLLSLHNMGYRLLSREDNLPYRCCSEFVFARPNSMPRPTPFPYGFHRPLVAKK